MTNKITEIGLKALIIFLSGVAVFLIIYTIAFNIELDKKHDYVVCDELKCWRVYEKNENYTNGYSNK